MGDNIDRRNDLRSHLAMTQLRGARNALRRRHLEGTRPLNTRMLMPWRVHGLYYPDRGVTFS